MQNYDPTLSNFLTYTAPSGGVVAGSAYLIGSLLIVATQSAAQGSPFNCVRAGVFDLPKAAGAWLEGQLIYWDNSARCCTTTSLSNTRVGAAAQAQASGDTTGRVVLPGVPAVAGVA